MFNFMKKIFNTNEDASMPFILKYNKAQANTMNYSDLFFENPCINRALNLITNSIADLELVVIKNGKFNSDSLVYKILKNPSKGVYTSDFIESLVLNYLLSGNAFIYLDDNHNLVNLVSDIVQIHFDKLNNHVAFYSIKTGENKFIKISADSKLPMIGHFKSANPSNPALGYSSLDSVKLSATLYQYIDRHNLSLIQNGGRPSGIVSINSTEPLTDKEQESLKEQFADQYLGPDQAGKIIFLNREFSWQQLSGNIKDMDYSDASRRSLRAIAAGLGVPANLIGDLSTAGENAKSNIESMFEIFNRTTISPLSKKLSQFLTMFFKDFEDDIEVKLISKEEFNLLLDDDNKVNKDCSL